MTQRQNMRLLFFVFMLLSSPLSGAELIDNWHDVMSLDKCNGGAGFFLWDSNKCLFSDETLFYSGSSIPLTEEKESFSIIMQKIKNVNSVGDKHLHVYSGNGIKLKLLLTYMPGCDYSDDQCTVRNFFADFELVQPGKRTIKFQGVGFSGS